jgi:hypothetical protein
MILHACKVSYERAEIGFVMGDEDEKDKELGWPDDFQRTK